MGESANRDHKRMKIDPEQRDILSNVGERAEDQKLVLDHLLMKLSLLCRNSMR